MPNVYNAEIDSMGGYGGGGFGGNPLLWLITLGFLRGNDGFFGGSGGSGAGVLAGELKSSVDCLQSGQSALSAQIASNNQANQFQSIAQLIQSVNDSGRDGRFALNQQLNDTRQQISDCCCETNRNIDDVKTQMAQQTSALLAAGTANTQRILDKLCDNTIALKDAEIRRLQDDLQTQTIVNNCNNSSNGGSTNIDINALILALLSNGGLSSLSTATAK